MTATWVYPTIRARVEEHKVHFFRTSLLPFLFWGCRLVPLPLFRLLSCSSVRKALEFWCVSLGCFLVREALCFLRGGGRSPVCYILLLVVTFPLCVLHVLSALSGGIVLLCSLPPIRREPPVSAARTPDVSVISIDRLVCLIRFLCVLRITAARNRMLPTGLPLPGRLPMTCLVVHQQKSSLGFLAVACFHCLPVFILLVYMLSRCAWP